MSKTGILPQHAVLDIGVTEDRSYSHSNYFEAWYPHKDKITATGIDDAQFLEEVYPGLRFVKADGRSLPFQDGEFDYVHSSAVLEHVGSADRQRDFLREAWRVSRRGIFITTPNRWFPIEFHTVLPLVHWLPPSLFRKTLTQMGMAFFASEENLNLLTARQTQRLASQAGLENARVDTVAVGGWPSNLLLWAQRKA
ncbi:MAG: class I SAM-dependent methyltransferase [Acidobacteriaceae bacterium]